MIAGNHNTCAKRFDSQLGELPPGYDHEYTYNHLGYNLKLTDMQAAIGCAQLERLDGFIERRRANAATLEAALGDVDWLSLPVGADRGRSSWCGDPLDERQKG